jgi:HAD superfamily hydrolase (TIGR01509 family)
MRPIRAVLFDLDGTLVDNMAYHIEAWIETGRVFGRELTREQIMGEFAGRRNEEILPVIAGRALSPAEIDGLAAQKEARYRTLYAPHLSLMPGAAALFELLAARNIVCGVASAAPRANREFVLNGLALWTRLGAVVGAEEVAQGKPAPDLFLEAARRLDSAPQDTLVFEDARLGVQAGRAAGMRVCGITTGEPREALLAAGALAASANFLDLPPEITALFGQ